MPHLQELQAVPRANLCHFSVRVIVQSVTQELHTPLQGAHESCTTWKVPHEHGTACKVPRKRLGHRRYQHRMQSESREASTYTVDGCAWQVPSESYTACEGTHKSSTACKVPHKRLGHRHCRQDLHRIWTAWQVPRGNGIGARHG